MKEIILTSIQKLSNKVIIVTGGTQGLGESIARLLAEQGAAGLVICGRNQEKGHAVANSIAKIGSQSLYVPADLVNENDCRKVVLACDERFGRVDGLVNAAGVTTRGNIENITVELWDYLFAINTRAPFIIMQESVRIMKREKRGGSIVNIISMVSHGGPPYLTAYSASKGALVTLTKNVANALRFDLIRVNGINMGWTATIGENETQKAMGEPDNWLELVDKEMPFKRILRPSDVAVITSYLISDDSEMMTGSIIDFDQNVIGCYD